MKDKLSRKFGFMRDERSFQKLVERKVYGKMFSLRDGFRGFIEARLVGDEYRNRIETSNGGGYSLRRRR